MLTACGGDPDSPPEEAEDQSSITRGLDNFAFNQGWRIDQHVRLVRDLDGDGLADVIGFGNGNVYMSLNQGIGGFTPVSVALPGFGNDQGYTSTSSIRTVADVNGDGLPDIVVIGPDNVWVALKTTTGYAAATVWSTEFSSAAGWHVGQHVFQLADVDADGKADLIGIDEWGVYVARSQGNRFETKSMWIRAFNARDGWDITKHPRMAVDINNDGRADIIGFGYDGTWAAISTGTSFDNFHEVSLDFGYNQNWRIGQHQRVFVNVDGDRYVDLVGIGDHAVVVARGGPNGFTAATTWTTDFVSDAQWDVTKHPRFVADVDGDGMADIVGIKDSQVFLARSTGTAFAAAQPVLSNEFTVSAGWDVAKHPRFLADVDGDHRLDLVGFHDDSMWWDRLTPVPAALPSGWDTPACAASRLGQPTPTTCEGPWQYTEVQRCVGVDNACPTYCSSFNACPLWENGATHTAAATEFQPGIVGSGSRSCTQRCTNFGCNPTTCSGTITPPTTQCQGAANDRATFLRTQAANAVVAEQTFDSQAAQNQRVTDAQNQVSVTASTPVIQTDFHSIVGGPGGTLNSWNEHFGCSLSVVQAAPVTAVNSACTCATALVHSSCEHDCGTTTKYTAPDHERPTSPYVSGQICMTHDDMPQSTPGEIQAKFEELWKTYQAAPPPDTVVAAETFKRAMVTRLKLIYELFGDKLIDQHTTTDQPHRAISLYKDRPNDNPACSLDIDAPATPAGCTNPAVAATRGDLIRCQRLLGTHAAESVASLAEADCTALLTGYLGLKTQTADDATCGGPHLRQLGAAALFKLEDKQLGVINSAPTTLGALPRQLYLLDSWYTTSKAADAAGVFPAPDQQRRDTSFLIGEFWDRLRANTSADAQLTAASQASTTDQAEAALGLSAGASRASEQSVVSALFTVPPTIQPENVTLDRPPLRSLPVLAMLGDALKPFIDDLDGLALYHDIACQFRDCRAPATDTPSRAAWKLLSELEASTLANDVTQNTHALAGWNPVLAKLATKQSTLLQAIGDALDDPGGGGLVDAKNEADVHPLARPLWLLFRHARAFHDHYETTGLFEPSAQNQLHGSLLSQDQHTVATGLRARVAGLDSMVTTYRNGLIAALQAEIAVMDNGAQLTNLTNQRLHKAEEMNQKGQNLEGLRAAGEDEDAAFGNLFESFADIQHALDQGAYVQVGDTATLTLNGRSGKFTGGSQSLGDLAVQTIPNLPAGQVLLLQTTGSWTPTCSLGEFSFLGVGGDSPLPANLDSAEIGPEGYTIVNSGGTATARSTGHSDSVEASAGFSFKYCESSGIAKVAGIEAEACVFAEVKGTMGMSTNDSESDDHRSSASFNSGIRLPNTPFPKAPTGSLLVVLADPTTGVINDIRVVHSGGTSILIENPSTAYVIANDRSCTTSGNTHALNVSYRTVMSQTAVADKALQGMADVLAYMRQQRQTWANQGSLLPSQGALLRQQANLLLQHRLDEIDVASLPGPLASLFDAFVTHQIVATERQIDVTATERSLQLDLIELRTIDDEFAAGASHARLQRLVPQWIVRDLDHDTLRHNLVDVLGVSRDFLKPILELWYPTALQGLSDSPEIAAMVNADVDTSLITLAGNGSRFVTALLNAYDNGTFGSKPPGQQLPVVVLNFPRPGSDFTDSFWRQADPTRARRVWDAIDHHTVAHFEVSPEDLYSKNGGDAVLACTEVVPLIKSMELYVVRPGGGPSNDTLNTLQRTFQGFAGVTQSFVTPDGPRMYELADAAWQSFMLPVRYGEDEAAVQTFNATPRQARPVGLSANGAFDVDFSILNTLPHDGEFSDGQGFPVTGVQLVLELDSRAVGTSDAPHWVDRCK